ncbi:MAG: hypothetical protein E7412_04780 [Ruminococcaceae bacterium]|nr:hypothetical protein [Oscillospiraceae bacterium]
MRRVHCLILTIIFAVGMLSSVVVMAEEVQKTVKVYDNTKFLSVGEIGLSDVLYEGDLSGAANYINYKGLGGIIVLSDDVKLSGGITLNAVNNLASSIVVDGAVTIDLNGYFITQFAGSEQNDNALIIVPKGSSLTIVDSSADKKGVVDGVQYAVSVQGGSLVVENGIFSAQSQAGIMDETELPLSVTDGGSLRMTDGVIRYSGTLDDGRLYYGTTGALFVDSESKAEIFGGTVYGSVEAESKENVKIFGGSFQSDVSEFLTDIYGLSTKDGLWVVGEKLPAVEEVTNNGSAKADVSAELDEDRESIKKYTVRATSSGDTVKKSVKLNITDIVKTAASLRNVPDVEVVTDFAALTFSKEYINELSDEVNGVCLTVEKNYMLDAKLLSKAEKARYEISFSLRNEKGEAVVSGQKASVNILHSGARPDDSIQLFSWDGEILSHMNSNVGKGRILCEAESGEKVVVSEGTILLITSRMLDMRGALSIVFYATVSGIDILDVKMLFWDSPQVEYTEKTAHRIVSYSGKDSNGYRFVYENIAAKDMGQDIYARLVATDATGRKIYTDNPEYPYSVTAYAENMNRDEKLRPLLVRLLNYGAAAQEYFGSEYSPVNQNEWMSDGDRAMDFTKVYLSDAKALAEENTNEKCISRIAGKTLILEGDITLNYYVSSDEEVDETGVLFWTKEAFADTEKHIMGTQSSVVRDYTENGKYKVFSLKNIAASEIFEPVYARVYTKKNNVYRYSDIDLYSVKDYAANQIEKNDNPKLVKLLRCLLLYGDEAAKYFGED